MRLSSSLVVLALGVGCGQKVDHPESAPACDPATMDCVTYKPPQGGSIGGGNEGEGGAATAEPHGATVTGQVVVYGDDFFDQGVPFTGEADVSAVGVSGGRVEAHYAGVSFELADVLKDAANWFLVKPAGGLGMLPTVTPVDTRIARTDAYPIGLASELNVDGLYVLLGAERATSRAQLVVTVVDEQGRSIPGVHAAATAEVTAYRQAGGWLTGDEGTDDTGMIFLGNVPASATLAKETIVLNGTVSARVEVLVMAGAVTVVATVAGPP